MERNASTNSGGTRSLSVLLGGTFDPIHLGHMHLAREILGRYPIERFYFVPAQRNPHKGEAKADANHRLNMVKLAIEEAGDSRLKTLDWEVKKMGPSYTIETVEKFGGEAALAMGNEVFFGLPRWKRPMDLLSRAHVYVVSRTSAEDCIEPVLKQLFGTVNKEGARYSHSGGKWVQRVEMEVLPFSATKIREALSKHKSMPQGIQTSVWNYIKENRLYAVKA